VEVGAKGQGPLPHVHILWHILAPNFAQAAIGGARQKKNLKGMSVEEPWSKNK
jgi:hypothetical protein